MPRRERDPRTTFAVGFRGESQPWSTDVADWVRRDTDNYTGGRDALRAMRGVVRGGIGVTIEAFGDNQRAVHMHLRRDDHWVKEVSAKVEAYQIFQNYTDYITLLIDRRRRMRHPISWEEADREVHALLSEYDSRPGVRITGHDWNVLGIDRAGPQSLRDLLGIGRGFAIELDARVLSVLYRWETQGLRMHSDSAEIASLSVGPSPDARTVERIMGLSRRLARFVPVPERLAGVLSMRPSQKRLDALVDDQAHRFPPIPGVEADPFRTGSPTWGWIDMEGRLEIVHDVLFLAADWAMGRGSIGIQRIEDHRRKFTEAYLWYAIEIIAHRLVEGGIGSRGSPASRRQALAWAREALSEAAR